MQTIEERIKQIEEEIRKTPYHKGTEHHIGRLKARIAKLKEEKIEKEIKSKGGGGLGYAVRKSGDATVVLIGPPSVGKSTLLNKLTNAESKVGDYDFTTLGVVPGMLEYKGAKIQIFDLPGIISGAASGKGRGKEVLSVARSADLIVIMVDVGTIRLIPNIFKELYEMGIRLNEVKPAVTVVKGPSGGIKIKATGSLRLSYETIKSLAQEFRLTNAEIIIKEDISLDRLIDALMANRVYSPFLVVINKIDLGKPQDLNKFLPDWVGPLLISTKNGENLDYLKEKIWEKLNLVRVYLKKGENIDKNEPLIIKAGQNLSWILNNIAIAGKEKFRSAKVYGPGAKYPGQEVSLQFVPQDEMIVQFI